MQLPEPALLRSYRVNDQNSWESLSWDRFCSAATTLYPPWHCVQIAFGRAPLGVSLSSCVYADVKSPVDDRVGTGACKLLSSLVVTIRWAYLGPFDLLLFNFISILLWYGLARLSERSRSLGKIFIQVRHVMFCCAYVVCMYVCVWCVCVFDSSKTSHHSYTINILSRHHKQIVFLRFLKSLKVQLKLIRNVSSKEGWRALNGTTKVISLS